MGMILESGGSSQAVSVPVITGGLLNLALVGLLGAARKSGLVNCLVNFVTIPKKPSLRPIVRGETAIKHCSMIGNNHPDYRSSSSIICKQWFNPRETSPTRRLRMIGELRFLPAAGVKQCRHGAATAPRQVPTSPRCLPIAVCLLRKRLPTAYAIAHLPYSFSPQPHSKL